MKKRYISYLLSLVCSILFLTSCENWRETAGDIAGMWQMTEWRDGSNNVIATKADGLYYCFQLNLLKFQIADKSEYYLTHFTHTGNELTIEPPIFWPDEEKRPLSELSKFGVPADGHFHIDVLNSSHMVISCGSVAISFRKY